MARTVLWLTILLLIGGGSVTLLWQALNLFLNGELSWGNALLPIVAAVVLVVVGALLLRTVERLTRADTTQLASGKTNGGVK
jgi:divalent metal cation (Fe/Co/Zn/Cd) transporter